MKSTAELKFVLTLLGCPDYRSPLSASRFNSFKGKNKICQDLGDRDLIDFSREIGSVKVLPPGRALLKVDPAQLPLSDKEFKVLEKIAQASGKTAPSKISVSSVKASEREAILIALSERGLIETETTIKKTKAEVWLTQQGIEYLRDDYTPKGAATISLDLLNNYTRFLRKTLSGPEDRPSQVSNQNNGQTRDLSDEEVLKTIQLLDRELGTDNYLPIFHLRQKLQPSISREQLDQALYSLQRKNKIDLDSLQEVIAYTPDQISAGIEQGIGGPLFFISVN